MQFNKKGLATIELLSIYKKLLLPRLIEEKMLVLLRQGKISKWFSGIGQEAIAVGAAIALQDDEWIMPLHRNLGVFTTRNMPLHKLFMQWQGNHEGYSKGRERSFHFGSREHHICGMISHLGPQLALADGVALAYKLRHEQKVSLAFSGEGGTSEGDFHEALNVAAVWDLPVIFLIENNGYSLSTPVSEQYRCENLVDKAKGYGMAGVKIDGNNILTVIDTLAGVREFCIREQKPFLVECTTFRMRGHEEASGTKYVPKELFDVWAEKDPIKNFEEYLTQINVLNEVSVEIIRNDIKQLIEKELELANQVNPMQPNASYELGDVYAPDVKRETANVNRETANVKRETANVNEETVSVNSESSIGNEETADAHSETINLPPLHHSRLPIDDSPFTIDAPPFTIHDSRLTFHDSRLPVPAPPRKNLRYIDAIKEGLWQSMQQHNNLILMGQDIAEYGGAFKITEGFVEQFGKSRVRNTPLCESAIVGTALGLSLEGFKSMMEMQFADFATVGFNQIINNLAKMHYRWGQQADVVIRMPTGGGMGAGPFHSQSNEAWFVHTPGLKVVYPATPEDAKGLLVAAINDPNPVIYFEHKALYRSVSGEVPEPYYAVEIGKAREVSRGTDISIITYGAGVHWAMEYAEQHQQISFDILDLRTLLPLDYEAIRACVARTGKVLVLHEDSLTGGVGGEVAAWICEHCFALLDAPVMRCASLDTPIPFNLELEKNYIAKARLGSYVQKLMEY